MRLPYKPILVLSGINPANPTQLFLFLLSKRSDSCYKMEMEIKLTAVFRKFPQGYAAFVEELPGANTQGATLDEARENLKEVVAMVLQANRELSEESLRGAEVLREPLALTTA